MDQDHGRPEHIVPLLEEIVYPGGEWHSTSGFDKGDLADARRVVQAVGSLFGQGDEDLDSGARPGRGLDMQQTVHQPGKPYSARDSNTATIKALPR
jgi:hypothetical protein